MSPHFTHNISDIRWELLGNLAGSGSCVTISAERESICETDLKLLSLLDEWWCCCHGIPWLFNNSFYCSAAVESFIPVSFQNDVVHYWSFTQYWRVIWNLGCHSGNPSHTMSTVLFVYVSVSQWLSESCSITVCLSVCLSVCLWVSE